jgi:hypothetical protein
VSSGSLDFSPWPIYQPTSVFLLCGVFKKHPELSDLSKSKSKSKSKLE